MKIHKGKNKITNIAMLIVAVSFIFCCTPAMAAFVGIPNQMSMTGMHTGCEDGGCVVGDGHKVAVLPSILNLLQYFVIILTFLILLSFKLYNQEDFLFSLLTRDKYGGSSILNYFNYLFSVGILHTKVY